MNMIVPVRAAGALLLGLAVLNVFVPRRFNWKAELARVSPLNRQIFSVHAGFIVLILLLMGVLSAFYGEALLAPSPLSRLVLGGLALFWLVRLFTQWFVYDASLWRGHRFNTAMHILFSIFWLYLTAVYAAALWLQLKA
jgi:hypothetical protein